MSTLSPNRPTARPALRLDFFGGPTLWRGDKPVRISPFQAGLLSLAFGAGQPRIPRSMVQTLLWDGDSDKAIRHRLSQLVYQTNHRCQARVVELEGEHVRTNTEGVATDLEELKGVIRTSDFKAACDILERGFLSALPNRKTEAFSDWIETQELGLRARLRNKALADWNASDAVQDWHGARLSAEALSRLDPHDETVLRRVIRAHAMGGRVGEAEAVYRSFAERADPSGGWVPQRATARLLKSMNSDHKQSAEKSGIAKTQGPEIPFAGRAKELSLLSRSICQTRSHGAWCVVTLSGEAGLGKTRMIEEAIQGARFHGCKVMHARLGEFERDIPFNPLVEALNSPWVGPMLSSVPDPWRSHLLSILPQLDADAKPPQDMPNDQSERLRRHTCEAFLKLFSAIAQSHQTVVVLDDFHWADEATATIVQFLQRRWRNGQLTLLLSYRQEELGRNEIAARLVNELEAEPDTTTIRLHELESSAARELVVSLVAKKLSETAIDDIVALAGGNPRFLIEIAADAMADSRPTQGICVPVSVRQGIVRRIGELAPNARSIMSALALLEHPATVRCLMGITGHTQHESIDALDLLDERRLVERTGEKVRIRQDIVRQAVYEGLSPTRRSLLHALTAEALQSRARRLRPDRIAVHYYHAGERQLACSYALEAARPSATRKLGDRSKFLRLAYETSEGLRRQRLTLPLARALHRSGQLADALRYGKEALREVHGLSPAESYTARLIIADARNVFGQEAPATTLDQLADLEAAALRDNEEAVFAELVDTTLRLLHREGDHNGVSRFFARVKRVEGLRAPVANCRVLATLAMQAAYGSPAEGLVCARRAVTIAREHDLHSEKMLAWQRLIAALAANGLLATEEGRTVVAEGRRIARRSDDLASHLLILLELAQWHNATGGLGIAARLLEEVFAIAEPTDCPEIRCLANLAGGNVALARGNLPAALAAIAGVHGPTRSAPEDTVTRQGNTRYDVPGEEAGPTRVPPYLLPPLAGLEGNVLLESGKLRQAARISETHGIEGSLTNVALDLILFHARLLSRKGDTAAALDLLERSAGAHEGERPLHWLRLTLDLVRLARRSGSPRPELAARARDGAMLLCLPELAHEFIPFT